MQFITQGILEALVQLYGITGNLGLSILLFTFIIRSLILPLSLPSIKAQGKIRELKPELDDLKKKHGSDKKSLQVAQMELYKKYNVNPLAGCLPQVLQLVILLVLYRVLAQFVSLTEVHGVVINSGFLWLDLSKPDHLYVLPILAAVSQLFLSIMILPGGEVPDLVPNQSKSKAVQKKNEKEEDMAGMAAGMQQQMLFLMPLMTGFLALRFPSGLVLYWVAATVYSVIQQYFLTGPGGLKTYSMRLLHIITSRKMS
jgi:YidC/Oxa1 family membrane protein insertase